jgi:CheY-like chemotaxis protein
MLGLFLQLIIFLFQTMKKVLEMNDPNELFDLVFLDFEMPGIKVILLCPYLHYYFNYYLF